MAAVAIAGIAVFLVASGISLAADPPKKLRLVYADWGVGTAVAYVGIDGGVFKKFNIDIEEIIIKDMLSGGVQSLLGGDVVIGFGNPVSVVRPMIEGTDLVLLGSHVSTEKFGMCVSDSIASVKSLKGKKIGVSTLGGRSDLAARVMLRRAGLDPINDVEVVVAGLSGNRAAAVSQNLIQGTPFNLDFSAQAKQMGLRVLDVRDVPMVTSLLLTTRSFVKRDEELLRRFVKGYAAATHFYVKKRTESMNIIKKYVPGMDQRALEAMYESFASQLKPLPAFDTEALQAMIDVTGVLDKRASSLKPKAMTDPHFLEELQTSGFIDQLYTEKTSL
jgi:ABC-type nitrate/sulfonate/bicarbonate transport system substrate-binding protein